MSDAPVVVYEPRDMEPLPSDHSLEENEETIRRGMSTFVEVGKALMEIRGSRQYITAGFDTFEDYCKARWDMARTAANEQIAASKVVGVLERDHVQPQSTWAARPLAKLLNSDGPEAVREAWKQIVDRHDSDGPITGREVHTFLNPTIGVPPSQRTLSDSYLSALDKLAKASTSIRWSMENYAGRKVPEQVREKYRLHAQTIHAMADAMDAIADGEELTRTQIKSILDVGVWAK